MTTATSGAYARNEPSDSSASATNAGPAPSRPPPSGPSAENTVPPIAKDGSAPACSSAVAIIADVVVLPCAPATATASRSTMSAASASDRCSTRRPALTRAGELGVGLPDGGRDDERVDAVDERGVVTDVHVDAGRAQRRAGPDRRRRPNR